jgi:hypothetical protein
MPLLGLPLLVRMPLLGLPLLVRMPLLGLPLLVPQQQQKEECTVAQELK